MILNQLDNKIKQMQDLQKLKLRKQKQEQQKATEEKFRKLIQKVHDFLKVYAYITQNLDFEASEQLRSECRGFLEELKKSIELGNIDKELLNSSDARFNEILKSIESEWEGHHSSLTSNVINYLKVISGIDSARVASCISGINSAKEWSLKESNYIKLRNALDNANDLILSLNLNEDVMAFLTKMTVGQATVQDLNETVLVWIKKEGLDKKIRLSFVAH